MIRRAEVKDINELNDMLYQVHNVHASKRPDIFKLGEKKYQDNELLEILKDDNKPIYVYCEKKDKAIGYIFCVKREVLDNSLVKRKVLYIDDLCVTKKQRGKGVAKMLYQYVKGLAINEGFDSIELNVWALNEDAYGFYKHLGLKELKILMEDKLK